MTLVLDSSLTLSWYFLDEQTTATIQIFKHVADYGAVVPPIWRFEVANVLELAARNARVTTAFRDASLADLGRFAFEVDRDCEQFAWNKTLTLASRHRLTVYDASYLEVAMRRRLPLATLDRALERAAAAERVNVLGRRTDA